MFFARTRAEAPFARATRLKPQGRLLVHVTTHHARALAPTSAETALIKDKHVHIRLRSKSEPL
eukprot:261343-Heterocapsa_arctica.AAC.1